jgi:hypothetical protein
MGQRNFSVDRSRYRCPCELWEEYNTGERAPKRPTVIETIRAQRRAKECPYRSMPTSGGCGRCYLCALGKGIAGRVFDRDCLECQLEAGLNSGA